MSGYVKRLTVVGLHGRTDIELDFYPDLNIVFGRNGSGKTTVLHIICNLLNRSFERFAHLQFEQITLQFADGHEIRLERSDDDPETDASELSIWIDGKLVVSPVQVDAIELFEEQRRRRSGRKLASSLASNSSLIEALRIVNRELRDAADLSPRYGVAYFPAFRTMIEAWRSVETLREGGYYVPSPFVDDVDETVETKLTGFARGLFGKFVPDIEYPSVIEIERQLSDDVGFAAFKIARDSEEILSGAFVDAFSALSDSAQELDSEGEISPDTTNSRLNRIEVLLSNLSGSQIARVSATQQTTVVENLRQHLPRLTDSKQSKVAARILAVYETALEQMLETQIETLAPIEKYINAVNEFLEGKHIAIASLEPGAEGSRVGVEFDDRTTERFLALSSGERHIVSMLYAATRSEIADSAVVLIDEPELSLHIDWQRRLIRRMEDRLKDRQLIVCTHSPDIGGDFADRFVELIPRVQRPTSRSLAR